MAEIGFDEVTKIYPDGTRAVSAVDGHATEGTLAFGVGEAPTGAAAAAATDAPTGSAFEVASRWILLLGLVALLGGAVAGVARFGGTANADLVRSDGVNSKSRNRHEPPP